MKKINSLKNLSALTILIIGFTLSEPSFAGPGNPLKGFPVALAIRNGNLDNSFEIGNDVLDRFSKDPALKTKNLSYSRTAHGNLRGNYEVTLSNRRGLAGFYNESTILANLNGPAALLKKKESGNIVDIQIEGVLLKLAPNGRFDFALTKAGCDRLMELGAEFSFKATFQNQQFELVFSRAMGGLKFGVFDLTPNP